MRLAITTRLGLLVADPSVWQVSPRRKRKKTKKCCLQRVLAAIRTTGRSLSPEDITTFSPLPLFSSLSLNYFGILYGCFHLDTEIITNLRRLLRAEKQNKKGVTGARTVPIEMYKQKRVLPLLGLFLRAQGRMTVTVSYLRWHRWIMTVFVITLGHSVESKAEYFLGFPSGEETGRKVYTAGGPKFKMRAVPIR